MISLNTAKVSTTKHPASIMMLSVVASNRENMPPVWFEHSYRLTSPVYTYALETKVLHESKNHSKKTDFVLQQDKASVHTPKTWAFSPKTFGPTATTLDPFDFSLWTYIKEEACKTQMSSMLLWSANGCRWRKATSGKSARASDCD